MNRSRPAAAIAPVGRLSAPRAKYDLPGSALSSAREKTSRRPRPDTTGRAPTPRADASDARENFESDERWPSYLRDS